MTYLPNEIVLSTRVTNRFGYIKQHTGITPNIMARIALLKALEMEVGPELLETPESLHQKIPRDVAFGDYEDIFSYSIKFYIDKYDYHGDVKELISNLIETGSYKIGSIKKPQDMLSLF